MNDVRHGVIAIQSHYINSIKMACRSTKKSFSMGKRNIHSTKGHKSTMLACINIKSLWMSIGCVHERQTLKNVLKKSSVPLSSYSNIRHKDFTCTNVEKRLSWALDLILPPLCRLYHQSSVLPPLTCFLISSKPRALFCKRSLKSVLNVDKISEDNVITLQCQDISSSAQNNQRQFLPHPDLS